MAQCFADYFTASICRSPLTHAISADVLSFVAPDGLGTRPVDDRLHTIIKKERLVFLLSSDYYGGLINRGLARNTSLTMLCGHHFARYASESKVSSKMMLPMFMFETPMESQFYVILASRSLWQQLMILASTSSSSFSWLYHLLGTSSSKSAQTPMRGVTGDHTVGKVDLLWVNLFDDKQFRFSTISNWFQMARHLFCLWKGIQAPIIIKAGWWYI